MSADATYQTKNYEKQGGDTWVIGGTLDIEGGKIVNAGTQAGSVATVSAANSFNATYNNVEVENAVNANATAINALIAALQGVGILP